MPGDMINAEFLIALVESRPALWDKRLIADPCERTAAWKDICRILNPDFNTLTKTGQHAHVRYIRKKWMNIRDAWKKSVTDKNRKTYKYSARLKFLEKNLTKNTNLSWSIIVSDDSDTDSSKNINNIKKEKIEEEVQIEEEGNMEGEIWLDEEELEEDEKRQEDDNRENIESFQGENEVNAIQFMDMKSIDDCPHISFFKGLLPILNKLGEDEVLEFQMGVIQILRNIRRRCMNVNQVSGQRYDMPSSSFDLPQLKDDREDE